MTDTVLISRETLEQAVDALNLVQQHYGDDPRVKALLALRAALAAPADPKANVTLNYRKMWQEAISDNQRLCAELNKPQKSAAPADIGVPPKDSEAVSREIKNQLCIDGTLNQALDNILACHEPDAIFAMLTELAHTAVDRAVIVQGTKHETSYPAQSSGNLDHGAWRWVPAEPTEAMLQVAIDESPVIIREHYARTGHYTGRVATLSTAMFADVYRAMLRVAPSTRLVDTQGPDKGTV